MGLLLLAWSSEQSLRGLIFFQILMNFRLKRKDDVSIIIVKILKNKTKCILILMILLE